MDYIASKNHHLQMNKEKDDNVREDMNVCIYIQLVIWIIEFQMRFQGIAFQSTQVSHNTFRKNVVESMDLGTPHLLKRVILGRQWDVF